MVGSNKLVFFVYCLFAWMVEPVFSHGRLMDPPARNSMWRFGFSNPVNYNDNELYCGGKMVQWVRNGGRCGVCGDPWHGSRPHEAGGKYANNIISRTYKEGELINVAVHLTANHLGWFEFHLCPTNDRNRRVDQNCLDQYPLPGADGKTTRFPITRGKYNSFFNFTLKLPSGLVCEQCLLQWKYKTGNTWDKDVKSGLYCLGCGPQEEFYNCADVSIKPKTITETKKTSNKNQLNSNRTPQLKSKKSAPNYGEKGGNQILNMAATTARPTERHTDRNMVTRIWNNQSQLNRKRQGWLWVGGQNGWSRRNGHVTKHTPRNLKDNNMNIAMTPKSRGDTPIDWIYSTTRQRQLIQTQNKMVTNSNPKTPTKSAPVGTPKSIWRWWVKRISSPVRNSNRLIEKPLSTHIYPQQRLVTRQNTKATPHSTETPTLATTKPPCYSKKKSNKSKPKSVISPVRSYHIGWWRQQALQSSSRSITPTWTLKPVLKCKALIPLSGGMDSWCFANCNANYCPPDICQCQKDLSYVPLYARNRFLGNENHSLNRHRPSPQNAWPETNALRVRTEGNFRRNSRLSPFRRQYYSGGEAAKTFTCRAVGLYSRISHFDDWCNRNCFLLMCPAFICQCSRG